MGENFRSRLTVVRPAGDGQPRSHRNLFTFSGCDCFRNCAHEIQPAMSKCTLAIQQFDALSDLATELLFGALGLLRGKPQGIEER